MGATGCFDELQSITDHPKRIKLRMTERISQFFNDSFKILPAGLVVGLLILFCIGIGVLLASLGVRRGIRWSAGLLLLEYIFFLHALTVIFRNTQVTESHLFTPFWSYRAIWEGNEQFSTQAIMNVVAFVPAGLLLTSFFRRMKWWGVLLTGLLISFSIEILQLLLHRGFAEFDDIFHNTLGCLIGFEIYTALLRIKRKKVL